MTESSADATNTEKGVNLDSNILISDSKRRRSNRKGRQVRESINYLKILKSSPTIIVDCSFDDKHSDRNVKSLVVQLSISYSVIRKSSLPFTMIICGVSERLRKGLTKTNAEKWLGVTITQRNLDLVLKDFRNRNIVYLSADSDDHLDLSSEVRYTSDDIFIVGGLIDRNKYKDLCKYRAIELELKTSHLPISESGIKLNNNYVLAINHVIGSLVKYNEFLDWSKALKYILPKRKSL
ncbi:tRNA -methyltransferase family protein [Cryptosporidium muris RN66]|uniref:tRNA (guanine(9)-N(1))-methyltransferase n=1 Tax=Cryptosporidium muris (strain RN66) TaxID=441375 RepID=B6AA30_CRYMR|nr:tRNA -methyltransferase family protein [Cryptosporidium muris RN66]EEA05071.1 tRNA -methyltransferase family protein [Cryptosporidium muris RN66]|eukprot:XP_002139420.1 tRNA -methyltransferase family protein [Cryptosporidium muris RN66]